MASSKLTDEEKLKRIIYLNNTECRYIVGDPEKYSAFLVNESPNIFDEYVRSLPNEILKLIKTASDDKLFPRRPQLFYTLAKILHHVEIAEEAKHKVTELALEICKSDEEFFDFIKYCSLQRKNNSVKLSHSVVKAVSRFYQKKSPLELAQSYAKFHRYHKWSHKDLIKLAHVKSDTPLKNIIINYILFKKTNDKGNEEEKYLIDLIKKSEKLRSTKEPADAVPIITELKLTIKQVCPDLHQSQQVWSAVLENMSVQEILPWLLKLYKLNFLKTNTSTQSSVLTALTSSDKVKASGVHPIEVFLHMKNFEKGGKPIDPKLLDHLQLEKKMSEEDLKKIKTRHEIKCPIIVNALQKCMTIACSNIHPTNKRYMVTIDVTEKAKNAPCLGNRGLTGLEAAVAYLTVLLRVEKDVTVATYNDKGINLVTLERKGTFFDHMEKIKSQTSKYVLWHTPLEWAVSEKKHIDVFINFVHHLMYPDIPEEAKSKKAKGVEPIAQYRKKVNLPNAKLVTFCTSSPRLHLGGGWNVFDALGFDLGVCQAVESFCRGNFS